MNHDDFRYLVQRYQSGHGHNGSGYHFIYDLNGLVNWAITHGECKTPFTNFPIPKKASIDDNLLCSKALAEVVEAIDVHFHDNLPMRLTIRGLPCLGLSAKDAAHFSINRVDLKTWEYIQDDVKGNLRFIPIPKEMRAVLGKLAHWKGTANDLGIDGRKLISQPSLTTLVRRFGMANGLPGLTPTLLKRSCIFG